MPFTHLASQFPMPPVFSLVLRSCLETDVSQDAFYRDGETAAPDGGVDDGKGVHLNMC